MSRPAYFFSDIADLIIRIDPSSALCWSFGIIFFISCLLNPISFRFCRREFVISPVAPRTTGITLNEYSGYNLFNATERATYLSFFSFSFVFIFSSRGTQISMILHDLPTSSHTIRSGLLCFVLGVVGTGISHQISVPSHFQTLFFGS